MHHTPQVKRLRDQREKLKAAMVPRSSIQQGVTSILEASQGNINMVGIKGERHIEG